MIRIDTFEHDDKSCADIEIDGMNTASTVFRGAVMYIEGANLYIWADINQEDYTHKIDLSKALETNRDG